LNPISKPPPPPAPPRADPLTSPLLATLLFGGVFLIAFLVNVGRFLWGLRPGPDHVAPDPSGLAILLGWLGFALASGITVAWIRGRIVGMKRRNLATGLIVGFFYAGACLLTFGETLRWSVGAAVLGLGVWAGTAYAVASGLSEAMGAEVG
jgi:hypothetical protein